MANNNYNKTRKMSDGVSPARPSLTRIKVDFIPERRLTLLSKLQRKNA